MGYSVTVIMSAQASQKIGRAAESAELVAALPEFAQFRKILDLGGGPGLIGMAIVHAHPELKGVIFEIPAVGKDAIRTTEEIPDDGVRHGADRRLSERSDRRWV